LGIRDVVDVLSGAGMLPTKLACTFNQLATIIIGN